MKGGQSERDLREHGSSTRMYNANVTPPPPSSSSSSFSLSLSLSPPSPSPSLYYVPGAHARDIDPTHGTRPHAEVGARGAVGRVEAAHVDLDGMAVVLEVEPTAARVETGHLRRASGGNGTGEDERKDGVDSWEEDEALLVAPVSFARIG